MGSGLEGLGNINTDNASATVATPYGYLNKVNEDKRKLEVNFSKFNDTVNMRDYLINYFTQECGLEAHVSTDTETDVTCTMPALYVTAYVNAGTPLTYKVYCVDTPDDANRFMNSDIPVCQAQIVLYGNYNSHSVQVRNGIELFSLDDIYEVNSAVDAADKKLPYVGIGKTKLSVLIGKILNNKYKSSGNMSIPGVDSAKSDMNNLGGAFQQGINQLKGSISEAVNSLKGMTASHPGNIAQPNMIEQQGQSMIEQQNQGMIDQQQFNGNNNGV